VENLRFFFVACFVTSGPVVDQTFLQLTIQPNA
jgi:hypothetical protein